ncbi:MAG: 16S rRNA (uracil(1498)-N(3))-methyltransferase [Proteobacteria bacterium]|nr:16S rRNA (uracil(1498)-N(3))-methyltransferase [Pseudomonadota bacterium]
MSGGSTGVASASPRYGERQVSRVSRGWLRGCDLFGFMCYCRGMPNSPRLYINQPLHSYAASGALLAVASSQAHYLMHVLRLKHGGEVRVFNGASGEWRARLVASPHKSQQQPQHQHSKKRDKKEVQLEIVECVRPAKTLPRLTLAFAPVKGRALEAIIRQGTELGVTKFVPMITEFCAVRVINHERLNLIALEAAEQCGRLCIPSIHEAVMLADFIAATINDDDDGDSNGEGIIFCDEEGRGRAVPTLTQFLAGIVRAKKNMPSIILIGPEGGFSPKEREVLLAQRQVVAVSLGEAILRADTATIVALGGWRMMHDAT